jgi:hypothetical protein
MIEATITIKTSVFAFLYEIEKKRHTVTWIETPRLLVNVVNLLKTIVKVEFNYKEYVFFTSILQVKNVHFIVL